MSNKIVLDIQPAGDAQLKQVLAVEHAAFGRDEEAELTKALLADSSASPLLSLLACTGNNVAVGHILFSHGHLTEEPNLKVSILAPLAVVPQYQRKGVGSALITAGLQRLANKGIDWVFVLGHIEYYPKFGFEPAYRYGLQPPHPTPKQYPDAWMVKSLRRGISGYFNAQLECCHALDQPHLWC